MAPIPDVRALTDCEYRLMEWLLAHGTSKAASYAGQLAGASVVSRCHCGCPTIDLAVEGQAAPPGRSTILADVTGLSPEGALVGIILHGRSGILSELEVYDVAGDAGEFSLPEPEALAGW